MNSELIDSQVFTMEPKTLEEAMKFSELIAKSSLVPKDYQNQPGNVLVAIQMGREIGLKPLQALQHIAVINGRPSVWGDAIPGLIQGSGKLEDIREDFDDKTMTATCTMKRKGQPTVIVRSFSMEDAKKAGLWEKKSEKGWPSTWCTYPKRMLQMRARSWCARDGFADVLKGLAIAEEQLDVIETVAEPIQPPKSLSAPKVEPQPIESVEQPPPAEPAAQPSPEDPVPSGYKMIEVAADAKCKGCQYPLSGQAFYNQKKGIFHRDCAVPVA